MKIYNKKSLALKENVYKVKNVKLKEVVTAQDVYNTAAPNMNQVGTKTYDLNNDNNQPIIVKGNFNRGDSQSLQDASKDMANQANAIHKGNPTKPVIGQMTAMNPSVNNSPNTNKSGNVEQLAETVVFSKKEMNDFLKTL